ncbi:MAG TPA: penicillin-binding transpeptidase domain-containing protein [Longimicrobium sp.]|nr:penicillin-binding transpeptidase domain-containing protein [Longimicrobium sp.]
MPGYLDTVLDWVLRGVVIAFGAGALVALARWLRAAIRERRERWAIRLALAMLVLAAVYAWGHARLLWNAEEITEGRMAWRRFGDPRETERSRGDVRGWILDCTGEDERALARYGLRDGEVQRIYPLGEAGANLIGGGADAEVRDYTVERLFARHLREPIGFAEQSQLHAVGKDLRLTICSQPTRAAYQLLDATNLNGAVIIQDVQTGALVAYAATGGPEDPPFGIKRYAPPGSVFKLAVAALWWENDIPEQRMACPPYIQIGNARIRNFESHEYASLRVPDGMLRVSCNTAAVRMALEMRQRLGVEAFRDAYQRFGFVTYSGGPPSPSEPDFWNTGNAAWAQRMTPPPVRVRFAERFSQHEWGQIAIGQGPVDVTPLAISRFLQAIGNSGVMMPPTLEWEQMEKRGEGRRIMRESTSRKLQEAMLQVVDSGTAVSAKARLAGTGWDLAGKTGTADVAGAPRPDAWFAGLMYGPDGRARYTIVVYLQRGGQGGRVAAPIAGEMTRFMSQQPQIVTPGSGEEKPPARTASAEGAR